MTIKVGVNIKSPICSIGRYFNKCDHYFYSIIYITSYIFIQIKLTVREI